MKPTIIASSASQGDLARDPAHADLAGFSRSVRDALRHLHDPVHLQTHPMSLPRRVTQPNTKLLLAGKQLKQTLLDTITSLQPARGSTDARARRRYDILLLRYVEALGVDEVAVRLAISRREYNRQHRQALDAVVSLLQDGADAFAALSPQGLIASTVTGIAATPSHLPLPLNSFIGRERELQEVLHLLQSARLVTLSGPPGTGKTRLALQIAQELTTASLDDSNEYCRDVSVVSLASIFDPGLVVSAIAQTLKVQESPHDSQQEVLVSYLHDRHKLLILDNFEHVLAAAIDVSHVLAACPNLKVLVTSRASLRITGEHEFIVPPLALPEPNGRLSLEELASYEAIHLYVDRARAKQARFRLTDQNALTVTEICRRLDGLPLAIELAASWSRVFSPQALLERLSHPLTLLTGGTRDMPQRQQTLRNAIEWSYQLLTTAEKKLFAQLSTFVGGWTLAAAEAICTANEDLSVLDGMASLVDKNLVRQEEMVDGEPRFSMLTTIHEYAQERFEALGETVRAVRRRHAQYYLSAAQEAESNIMRRKWAWWLRCLNRELGNLRAAFAWFRDSGEIEAALQLGGALQWFWYDGGYWREGLTALESALALSSRCVRSEYRAKALAVAGLCNWSLGNLAAGRSQLEESLDIWREVGDQRGLGRSLIGLAAIAAAQNDLIGTKSSLEDGLSMAQAAGDQAYIALALHDLGVLAGQESDDGAAQFHFQKAQHVWQEMGSIWGLSMVANSLGDLARLRGRYEEAATHYQESLKLVTEVGSRALRAVSLHNLGHVIHRQGDDWQARGRFAEAISLFRDLGDRRGVAECIAGLACIAAETQPQRAARLFGAATAAVESMGSQLNASNQADYNCGLATIRGRLDEESIHAAWMQGQTMAPAQAVAEALDDVSV